VESFFSSKIIKRLYPFWGRTKKIFFEFLFLLIFSKMKMSADFLPHVENKKH